MGSTITLRRGYNIKLHGTASKTTTGIPTSNVVAVKPADFAKIKPKVIVSPGDTVKAGQSLFIDKLRPELCFTSPVSGEVAEIILGAKRRIMEIRILSDKENTSYVSFPKADLSTISRDALIQTLVESGCWNYIRQRPFSVIANRDEKPKAIFISCFDTSPLAPDLEYVIAQEADHFQAGVKALQILADGHLHFGLQSNSSNDLFKSVLADIPGGNIHYFKGPHPAGNVGIQIHHVNPIQKGEMVWYVHPQDVIIIGRLLREGRYRAERLVALTGSSVSTPRYVKTITGQKLSDIVSDSMVQGDNRIIQGNVLHGHQSSPDDFLSFYTNHISVIPEGREPAFLGWMLPGFRKLSLSRSYFSWLAPQRTYTLNTNKHGEERAFVMTGQYDKVLPMNILPVFLLKAILAKDIEKMEELGIYEVSEEDFALCEFVCTSKIDVQHIISQGLDLVQEEG